MLERIMDLHILLYLMAVLGTAGGVGMLAVHLTYRRTMRKTKATTNLREKWLNLWKTRDKLLNRMNLLVWIPSLLATAVSYTHLSQRTERFFMIIRQILLLWKITVTVKKFRKR